MLQRAQEEVKKRKANLRKLKQDAKKKPKTKSSPKQVKRKPLRKGQYYKEDGTIGRYRKVGDKFVKEEDKPA